MPQADKNAERKELLIEATVQTVAEYGLENTRTADICRIADINVAYMYRLFRDKEDLIAKAFDASDDRFLKTIMDNFPVLHYQSIEYEMRCRMLFMHCWEHILNRRMYTVFYVRYYYSLSFQKYSYEKHMLRYAGLLEKMKPAFPETVDVKAIMHHILDALLGMAMKQINDPQESDEAAGETNFGIIFSVVKNYINRDILSRQDVPKENAG